MGNNLFTLLGNPHNAGSLQYRVMEMLDTIEDIDVRTYLQTLFRTLLVENEDTINTVAVMLAEKGVRDFHIKQEKVPLIGNIFYLEPNTHLKVVKGKQE